MASIIQKLGGFGLNGLTPPENSSSIRISNILSWAYLLFGMAYMPVIYGFTSDAVPKVFVSMLVALAVPFLNQGGFYTLARFVFSINLPITFLLVHIGAITVKEDPIPSFLVLQTSFLILPWLMFNLNEIPSLTITGLVSLVCILLVSPLNDLLEPQHSNLMVRNSTLLTLHVLFAGSIVTVALWILKDNYQKLVASNDALASEASQNMQSIQEGEKKLNDYILQIEKARQEDKQREWASNGLAKFAELLRSNESDYEVIYNNLLSHLIKYIEANQGALFIYEQSGKEEYLQMVACYAYNKKKFVDKKVQIGEGLLGQAYLEKDLIFLTEIPQNYTYITSGLGDATPTNIVIIPLMVNEVVFGILEIASFTILELYKVEFLKKLGESLAAAISALKVSATTKELLKTTLEQTEAMKSQEEELRQNMEEMQATHEEMGRLLREVNEKEAYLNDILNASKDGIATVDKNYKMISCNKEFDRAQAERGIKTYKGLDMLTLADDAENRKLLKARYDKVFTGQTIEIQEKTEQKGHELHYIITYVPVFNADEQVMAAAVYSKNVTEVVLAKIKAEKLMKEAQQQTELMAEQEEALLQTLDEMTNKQLEIKQILDETQKKEKHFKVEHARHLDENEYLKAKLEVLKKSADTAFLSKFKEDGFADRFKKYEDYQTTGRNVKTFIEAIDPDFREVFSGKLDSVGISAPYTETWYNLEKYLKVMYAIKDSLGDAVLFAIGKAMLKDAQLPPHLQSLDDLLGSLNTVYHIDHAHKGKALFNTQTGTFEEEWTIGGHEYHKIDSNTYKVVAKTPYPDALEHGVFSILARKFEPNVIVEIDTLAPCRDNGADGTTFLFRI